MVTSKGNDDDDVDITDKSDDLVANSVSPLPPILLLTPPVPESVNEERVENPRRRLLITCAYVYSTAMAKTIKNLWHTSSYNVSHAEQTIIEAR
jgi:hypothetical protein